MEKKNLSLKTIKTVEVMMEEHLFFLPYSTRKRNIAYQMQYFSFMRSLYSEYSIYGSVKSIFIQQFIILIHAIAESLLYSFLESKDKLPRKNKYGHVQYVQLIAASKKINPPFITKKLYNNLVELDSLRNLVHPVGKGILHYHKFSVTESQKSAQTLMELLVELKSFRTL